MTATRLILLVVLCSEAVFAQEFLGHRRKAFQPAATSPGLPSVDNTLVLFLACDEGSGTNAHSAQGYNFRHTGTWATGKSGSGYALQFNGSSEFAASSNNLAMATNWVTVCAWIYWDTFANDDDLAMELGPNYNTTKPGFLWNPNSSGTGRFDAVFSQLTNASYRGESFTRFSSDTWTHVAVVFDRRAGAADIKVYLNGSLTATTVDFPEAAGEPYAWVTGKLYLFSRAGTALFGAGRLDSLFIFYGELDSTEITAVMNYN